LVLFLLAVVAGGTQAKQHVVRLNYADGVCAADFDGRRLASKDGYPDATGIRADGGVVRIVGSNVIPYKCIGGVIYTLQVAGFQTIHYEAGQHNGSGAPTKAGAQTHR